MGRMGEHRNCKLAQTNLNTNLKQGGLILLYLNWTSLFFGGVSEFYQTHWIQFFLMLFLAIWLTGRKKKKSKPSQKLKESFHEKWKVGRV